MKLASVFISHSAKQEIGPLLDVLKGENVTVLDSFDSEVLGRIGDKIRSAIDGADAVIAIVDPEADSANVAFEIGYATALRKPVLVLMRPGRAFPEFIGTLRYLVAGATDSRILRIGVRGFLKDLGGRETKRKGLRTARLDESPNRAEIHALLTRLAELRPAIEPVKVERITADLLRAASVTALEEQDRPTDKHADFALWSDDLHASVGNPILVEVKSGNLSESRLSEAYHELVQQVSRSDARFGLLLYFDRHGRRFSRPSSWVPVVLAFELEDFAKELLTHSFAKVLLESRNKLVHGMP
jgi:hypothetical protein